MNSNLNPYIIELESKIQILELENETLSAKAEENLLLNRAFEEINVYDDIDNLLLNTLESISILLNIQFSGLFDIVDKQLICRSSYSLFSNEENVNIQLEVQEDDIQRLLSNEACFLNRTDAGFIFSFPNSDFVAENAIIIPSNSKIFKSRVFTFINDISDQDLNERRPLFEKIIRIITARLERIYFQNELLKLNKELEKKVELRTNELFNQNIKLVATNSDLIEAKGKAEQSDRLKTAFMNNISHEIRTPLNAILGFAPFVIEPNISQEEKEQFLNMLFNSGERLMNTVTDYMDISLLVSDSIELFPKQFDISLLLKEILEQFQGACAKKNLAFNMDLPEPSDQFMLNSDRELVRKIVTHLVDNAVKFTETGSVEFGYVLKTESEHPEIELFVKDTGHGISLNAQTRIFDAFMQENIATTRGYEGSGLGLSIAKGLTKLLGGEIRLESEQNIGTKVFVTFPVETAVLSEQTKVDSTKNREENYRTILVAEDEESNYLFIETTLKRSFDKILKAVNGQEAVDLCHKHPEIDLILMDIKMPVMGGIEATRLIKSFRKDLPIIAVTAYAQTGDEHRYREAGCDDYISKPFKKEKLVKLIEEYFKK